MDDDVLLTGELAITGALGVRRLGNPSESACDGVDRVVEVNDHAYLHDTLGGTKGDERNTTSVWWVDDHTRSSSAELNSDGSATYSMAGKAPRGEDGAVDACRDLIHKLNLDGANWGEPLDLSAEP